MSQTKVTAEQIETAVNAGRNETISLLKTLLKERTGKTWSVRGGKGTVWGWIDITSLPRYQTPEGYLSEADREELGKVLHLGSAAHHQGIAIPASMAHRREYLSRASGLPFVVAEPYWD